MFLYMEIADTHQSDSKGSRNHGKKQRHGETFESMSHEEMSEEFDFEGSNAQFEKCE